MPYFQGTFEDRCLTTGAPTHLSFFSATFSAIFMILNIPGNLLVVLAVAIDPYKNLRNPFNLLMANLAVADLVVGTLTEPISIYFHIKEGLNQKIPLPEIRTFHMSYFISCTASVLSITTLAVERYFALCHPHTYRNMLTGKRILATIAAIWFVTLTLPFVYFEVGFITYAFIFANTSVVVAIAITCFTYITMVYKLKQRTKDRANSTTTTDTNNQQLSMQSSTSNLNDNAVLWEHRVTKMFLVVMTVLLCCYAPSTILIYVMSFCKTCSCITLHWFRDLQFLLISLNSSVNFFCYALRSSRFREAFAFFLRIPRRRRAPSVNNTSGTGVGYSSESPESTTPGCGTLACGTRDEDSGMDNKGVDHAGNTHV